METKPIALSEVPGLPGVWQNPEYTFLSFDRLEDLPPHMQAPIKTWIGKWICSVERELPAPTLIQDKDGNGLFIYQLKNNIMHHAAYETGLVDAALTAPGAKMSLGGDNSALLIEHDTGFYLISNINLEYVKTVDFY
jgi:hypothetical protein